MNSNRGRGRDRCEWVSSLVVVVVMDIVSEEVVETSLLWGEVSAWLCEKFGR